MEVPPPTSWSERLGNCPEALARTMLENTTQYYEGDVEMDNREIPRQQRKQRLGALHVSRVTGRTDTDTFFANVKSIRGFKACQLFVNLPTAHLWGGLLKKEKHNSGAYQDYIREIGAPNVLGSDNAQSETGNKWKAISRTHCVDQITTTPHGQHQNGAELKVRGVKHRTIRTLFCSGAPQVFWCYCLAFIINCWNHTSRPRLGNRNAMTALFGHTTDISKFRFKFWEAVFYFEPTAKFPEPVWRPARWIGFADKCGDDFTYKVWTVDSSTGDWTKGRALLRNIVIRRKEDVLKHPGSFQTKAQYETLDFETSRRRFERRRPKQTSRSTAVRNRKALMASKRGSKRGSRSQQNT